MTPDTLPAILTGPGRIVISTEGCWLRQVRILERGYSLVTVNGKQQLAHRAAYEIAVGPIPTGLGLDHVCHSRSTTCPGGAGCLHRRCCNPDHLEPVTALENHWRSPYSAGRRTHCPQGHPYDEANTRVSNEGKRECRICRKETARRYYDRVRRSPHVPVTECVHGHPYSGENLRIVATTGARVCRTCELQRGRAYKARKRAERDALKQAA